MTPNNDNTSNVSSPEKTQLSLSGLVTGASLETGGTPCTPGDPLTQLHHKHKVRGSNKDKAVLQLSPLKGHSVYGFSAMNRMRINGQLCDVKLKSGMVVVPAHRLVLASVSPYFHAMFNGKY